MTGSGLDNHTHEHGTYPLSDWACAREARRRASLLVAIMPLAIAVATLAKFGPGLILILPAMFVSMYGMMYLNYRRTLRQERIPALGSVEQLRSVTTELDQLHRDNLMLLGSLEWAGSTLTWRPRQTRWAFTASVQADDVRAWNIKKVWGVAVPNYYVHVERRDGASLDFWTHYGPSLIRTRPKDFPEPA